MERVFRRSLHSVFFFFNLIFSSRKDGVVFNVIKVKMGMILISVSRTRSVF